MNHEVLRRYFTKAQIIPAMFLVGAKDLNSRTSRGGLAACSRGAAESQRTGLATCTLSK